MDNLRENRREVLQNFRKCSCKLKLIEDNDLSSNTKKLKERNTHLSDLQRDIQRTLWRELDLMWYWKTSICLSYMFKNKSIRLINIKDWLCYMTMFFTSYSKFIGIIRWLNPLYMFYQLCPARQLAFGDSKNERVQNRFKSFS